jgi:hypothetical protein
MDQWTTRKLFSWSISTCFALGCFHEVLASIIRAIAA